MTMKKHNSNKNPAHPFRQWNPGTLSKENNKPPQPFTVWRSDRIKKR